MTRDQLPENFCALPFVQLGCEPTGKLVPCCFNDYEYGDIREQNLDEIWNGEPIQKLREEFMTGDLTICKKQVTDRQCHKWSDSLLDFVELKKVQTNQPKKMFLELNGKCNLECIMCIQWMEPNGRYTEENFWKHAREKIFPGLAEVFICGGETFIQKDTYKLIDEITSKSHNCEFQFITNAHWRFSAKIRETLDKIEKLNNLHVSIDSLIPEVFSKIRLKGKYR